MHLLSAVLRQVVICVCVCRPTFVITALDSISLQFFLLFTFSVLPRKLDIFCFTASLDDATFLRVGVGLVVEASHHVDELFEGDLAVPIRINLSDYIVHIFIAHGLRLSILKDFSDFVSRYDSRAVLVKHSECGLQLILGCQLVLLHRCHDKLRVVDVATVIRVHGVEHPVQFLV